MSVITHKYTPSEISDQELEATFAARNHTIDYLLKSLRDQIHSGTLSSFVITGPRGAGKSTVVHMVALRIRQDPELSAAWIPVVFPEEQFDFLSLRDLLAATLQMLVKEGILEAKTWLERVETEANNEQSQQLAITGLREIMRQRGKRLVLFIENLNLLLDECFNDHMKGTLRRLLMDEPFMLLISSAVRVFSSLKRYDEAFFNYFGEVRLDRLTAEEVFELLTLRAKYDGNERFLKEFPGQQPKVRAIVHLSGGNPRLVLMLYELLSQQKLTTIVQYLRRLVDELTPLLKDEMENLPPQQRKIIHALMEKGGTAQPSELVGLTRLPLGTITAQLRRLKDVQIVEVLGGGKGRAAHYTVPDKLFAIWFQMRYLSQNRRRIELFVEVLRIWFEEDERLATLRSIAENAAGDTPQILREHATAAEYYAASLKGTKHERLATDLCVSGWVKTDLHEAAKVHADLSGDGVPGTAVNDAREYASLGDWLSDHDDHAHAVEALSEVLSKGLLDQGEHARALLKRGVARGHLGDVRGELADYTTVIELEGAPEDQVAKALFIRGSTRSENGDAQGAIADYTAIIELEGAPTDQVAWALMFRGFTKNELGDVPGALADYAAVIGLEGSPKGQIAKSLFLRGFIRGQQGDVQGELADYSAVINLDGAPKDLIARALLNRGFTKIKQGDIQGAFADYSAIIEFEGAPKDQIAKALLGRGFTKKKQGDVQGAIADYIAVIDIGVMAGEVMSSAAKFAFRASWNCNDQTAARMVMEKFSSALRNTSNELAREISLRFLRTIATPKMKDGWPVAWQILAQGAHPEVAEALGILEPVCAVLSGKNRSLLEALPPEQREFVQDILSRFETKQ